MRLKGLTMLSDITRLIEGIFRSDNVNGNINIFVELFRLHLLPDERRYLQSKQKKKTCNPYFDETLVFQVGGNFSLKSLMVKYKPIRALVMNTELITL